MKIVICGSMSSAKEMVEIKKELERYSHVVVLPRRIEEYIIGERNANDSKESIENKIKDDLIRDYFNEIGKSDALLTVNIDKNGIKNYIGGNAFLEIGFAHVLNKKIFLLNPIPDMAYTDEIIAMQPIVLKGNVEKISMDLK